VCKLSLKLKARALDASKGEMARLRVLAFKVIAVAIDEASHTPHPWYFTIDGQYTLIITFREEFEHVPGLFALTALLIWFEKSAE
jgi:hypothetical protein